MGKVWYIARDWDDMRFDIGYFTDKNQAELCMKILTRYGDKYNKRQQEIMDKDPNGYFCNDPKDDKEIYSVYNVLKTVDEHIDKWSDLPDEVIYELIEEDSDVMEDMLRPFIEIDKLYKGEEI